MAVDNEELMEELQRVSMKMRRRKHPHMRPPFEGSPEGAPMPEGGHPCPPPHPHHPHPHHWHGEFGFGKGPGHHGPHGPRCHGGAGHHGQNRILAVLMMQDGTSQKDLAYLLGIRPQSLTQALESLEEGGFIERRADEGDKRAKRVYLTDEGRERAAKVAEERKERAEGMFSMLTEEEKEQLSTILGKIDEALD